MPKHKNEKVNISEKTILQMTENITRLRTQLLEVVKLQKEYYGDATDTHIELDNWVIKHGFKVTK